MGTITVYYHTHRGLVRNKNEDGILANKRLVTNTDMDAPVCLTESMDHHLLVVADGMGGHGNGSLASEIVLRTFVNGTGTPVLGRTRLLEVIYKAKTNLDHAVNMDRVLFDMGATLAGIAVRGNHVLAFNSGDCRVYKRSSGNGLEKLTRDHSLVQALVDDGQIDEDEMIHHPNKNIVTSCLVGDLRSVMPEVFIRETVISRGDLFFLCSDGVWENFEHSQLEAVLEFEPNRAALEIVNHVLESGAVDNFTFVLVVIE